MPEEASPVSAVPSARGTRTPEAVAEFVREIAPKVSRVRISICAKGAYCVTPFRASGVPFVLPRSTAITVAHWVTRLYPDVDWRTPHTFDLHHGNLVTDFRDDR
ncbi:hypothetical protein GCM10023205_04660 [Yinghuangia aomiensis]|uniref:Transposase n=1 Tax=Yinghuangia aomiensis TaxID=676205 RepID=A0ABP9GLX1_9ACTN